MKENGALYLLMKYISIAEKYQIPVMPMITLLLIEAELGPDDMAMEPEEWECQVDKLQAGDFIHVEENGDLSLLEKGTELLTRIRRQMADEVDWIEVKP